MTTIRKLLQETRLSPGKGRQIQFLSSGSSGFLPRPQYLANGQSRPRHTSSVLNSSERRSLILLPEPRSGSIQIGNVLSFKKQPRSHFTSTSTYRDTFLENARRNRYERPYLFWFGWFGLGLFLVTAYVVYRRNALRRADGTYPKSVARKLRTAIYYTYENPNSEKAIEYYQAALRRAKAEGLDEISYEVLGIWEQFGSFFVHIQQLGHAATILEEQKDKILNWIHENGGREEDAGKRTKLLQRAIMQSFFLSQLYHQDPLRDLQRAEELLEWAAETTLKENKRRTEESSGPGEEDFLPTDQLAAILGLLGTIYNEHDKPELALQALKHALYIKPTRDCDNAELMLQIGTTIMITKSASGVKDETPMSEEVKQIYQNWLRSALETAKSIPATIKTPECDSCIVRALITLGAASQADGDLAKAKDLMLEGLSLAHAAKDSDCMGLATEALHTLEKDGYVQQTSGDESIKFEMASAVNNQSAPKR